jgi:cytosine permease
MSSETVASAADRADSTEEYHDKPVPLRSRLGFKEPALVWSGFGIAYICAVIGGLIQQGLGTINAILAILLGNFILFLYSAAIGYANGKWGMNFPLTVKAVFGRKGAIVPIIVMAVLVTGWYAFQAWLTADILRAAFGLQGAVLVGVMAAVIAVIFGLPVIFGIKSMAKLMQLALPGMLIFAAYYLITKIFPAGGAMFDKTGDGKLAFMAGVGMAWSTFVVSGTMTGDIVRYTHTGKQAVWVTAVAFLFSNAPFMVLGALIAAAIPDPTVQYFFDQKTVAVLLPLLVLAILSNWSTCDACLYNATMGYTNSIKGLNWRNAAIVGTVIGVVAAGTGVIGNIVSWLILLGLIVPPIGGAIIADYYVVRGDKEGFSRAREIDFNWAAIIAVVVGIVVGWWVNKTYPTFLFGVAGIASSFLLYIVLARISPAALGADVSSRPSGAEAASA